MALQFLNVLGVAVLILLGLDRTVAQPSSDLDISQCNETIDRDVAIVGGGSGGTYTAIRLREENKSVVVIEAKDKLGGHTETYIDPKTGHPINIGVVVWDDIDIVRNYAASLGVPLKKGSPGGGASSPNAPAHIDFRTGKPFAYKPLDQRAVAAGIKAFEDQLAKYPYLNNGFDLPKPVPEDLLLPFGDFAAKYNLSDAVPALFQYDQGATPFLKLPMLYIAKYAGADVLPLIPNGFLFVASGNMHDIYDSAQRRLGADVLLSSRVFAARRDAAKGVQLGVHTPNGTTLVRAKKLVIAAPPTPATMKSLDPSKSELDIFGQITYAGYYTGVLRNTGLPAGASISNGAVDTPYQLPDLPGAYTFSYSGSSDLFNVYWSSALPAKSDEDVKADILAELRRLGTAGTYNVSANPEFAIFSSHVPYFPHVTPDKIRKGFYDRMNALQGQRSTWFTGSWWQTQGSSNIWNYTEMNVLPKLLA